MRPALSVNGGKPWPARAWLITARTWFAGDDCDEEELDEDDEVDGAPVEAG
ncbi:hypothetical protein [Catenulispora rubra]|uniref:hypothetical protein n=1 Tax=Catenulispora rubra TaxID=280293 RepID=UPI001E4631FC|nr:hypothetical protein [Catenulispora rubra]